MKFRTSYLKEAIKKLQGIAKRNHAEVQKGILLADNRLSASNTEMAMSYPVDPSLVPEEFIIPEKAFGFIQTLTGDETEITLGDNNSLTISCGKAKSKVTTYDMKGYVKTVFAISENPPVIDAETLYGALDCILYAVDEKQNDKRMQSAFFETEEGKLHITGVNGVQIASASVPFTGEIKMLVPKAALNELFKMKLKGDIRISTDGKGVTFESDGAALYSRLFEEEYFNTKQFLAMNVETSVVNKLAINEALLRVNACAQADQGSKLPVVLEFSEETGLKVSYNGAPNYEEVLEDVKIGKDARIGFSPKLITESLNALPSDEIEIAFTGANQPLTIKDGNVTSIVMPVKIQ